MKKTIILVGLIFASHLVNAQDAKSTQAAPNTSIKATNGKKGNAKASPEEKADKFVAKMTEAIGLEEAQKSKVKSLALDHFKNMETVRSQAQGDKEKIKAEAKNSRKIFNAGLRKVLTPAQFDAWKVKRKEAANKLKQAPSNEPVEMIED